ncbi:MarR family transcriptional regulator [Prauserella sp. PE36]|uniref:MarR family winged helix-turn-helix transcriptional regulator n=1 Tax=Prauserella sp. PE36 TaxID=1504709 RepID=UPI000DE2AC53|nr:MarR family transcriptional regulator [Prauserella sp. PE36]RBM12932.1 MarR family transcriptional regulator [Prauserella sp. PE36]
MAPASQDTARPTAAELTVADELGAQLVRFMRAMTRAKSQVAKRGPDGIERAAYAILFTLVHDGPQRTSRLAESLHSDISTISRQSSSLVQHGLVERTADPEDGRACLLAPTDEGLRVFEENRRLRGHWLAKLLADWPEEDRHTLTRLIDRLNAAIENFDPQQFSTTEGDNA